MDSSGLNLLKKVGYKNIFNYLYTTKYKDHLFFDEIQSLDAKYRHFFECLLRECPEEALVAIHIKENQDPTEAGALFFLDLYSRHYSSSGVLLRS